MKAKNEPAGIPPAMSAYWTAANAGRSAEAAACFSENAEVRDEGNNYRGRAGIESWIEATYTQAKPWVEPLKSEKTGEGYRVEAMVSGNFPSSPVELTYHVTLKNNLIATLSIE
jgi:hypothetical protein